jgi:DUF1680 family protein
MEMLQKEKLKSLPLSNIDIKDAFWCKYTGLVKKVIIPYQWNILSDNIKNPEPSGSLKNFKIAAKRATGEFKGAVFQDTDVAKWLEAVAYILSIDRDKELEKTADEVIDLIGDAQCEDGYINTYFTIKEPNRRWTNLMEGHELYTAGHLIEAAVAYYEATRKDKFLKIMMSFADLICNTFGIEEHKLHGYPGHQEIELALMKLYEVTGIRRYADTAKYFIDIRGKSPNYFKEEEKRPGHKRIFPEFNDYQPIYSQSHLPVREQKTVEGHAVRAVYMYCAMADIAYEYQDEELMNSCKILWDNMVTKRMYITGSIGSSGFLERFTTDYDLPNDINYSETCASIGLSLFGLRMMKITKEAKYIDVVERALYNTVLAGIAMDGENFFYVNPLEVWPNNCLSHTSKSHIKPVRQSWFGVACCPPNIARTLASLGQYIYCQSSTSLYVNLFISNKSVCYVNDNKVSVELATTFPFENNITMKVSCVGKKEITLAIRIPGYAENFQMYINEELIDNFVVEKGYAKISKVFKNDTIRIIFQAPAKYIHANPRVRADILKTAIVKGPLIYCLEEVDNGENLAAILVDCKEPLQEKYEENLLKGTTVIESKAKKVSEKAWSEDMIYEDKGVSLEDIRIKAVPYCYWGNRKKGEMLVWLKELI